AGHGHGVERVAGEGGDAPRHERRERGARAGAAGTVVAPDRLPRHVQHAEAIAADARHLRLDDAQHGGRGHRRVGCVAAGAQRLDGGKARQGMRGRRHALAGDDRRAARQLKIAAHGDSRVPLPKFANPLRHPLMRTSQSKGHEGLYWPSVRRRGTRPPSYVPNSISFGGICSKMRGGFCVSSQQSESADDRPNTAGQNGAIVDQAASRSSAGERDGAETPATRDKATSGERKHWLDYATAFLTLAAAGGAITAAVFTGWQATTADQGLRASN